MISRSVRLSLEVLEGREAPATIAPTPTTTTQTFIWYPTGVVAAPTTPGAPAPPVTPAPVTPPVLVAPGPIVPLPAAAPPPPTSAPLPSRQTLAGTVLGDYISTLSVGGVASGFHFNGSGTLRGIGLVDMYVHLYSIGFHTTGTAHGDMTLSNAKGSVKLALTGPTQTWLAPLPDRFSYRVVKGTGAYAAFRDSGTLKLSSSPAANPVIGGIRYFEAGSFTLVFG